MFNPATIIDIDELRGRIDGDVFTADDPTWDVERAAWNLAVDQQPKIVALPETAADVAVLVEAARASGLRVAPQGTGHNAAPYGDLGHTMLLRTSRMRGVDVDPDARTARVEAGVTWGEVAEAIAPHGLMALQGSSHDVGVVGYSLGGGVSLLARKHGLSSERLLAVEIVTADGVLRRVDRETEPELFWALRGGGGSFGVVTAVEIALLEQGTVYGGAMLFGIDAAAEVLKAWRRWTEDVPEEMTSIGSLRHFPPLPDVPEPLRGQSFTVIEAYWLGSVADGDELLAPLRELGPVMDNIAEVDAVGLLPLHMDPPGPVPGIGDHQMLSDLDDAAIDRVVAIAGGGTEGPPVMFEARHAGGALARRADGCGALGALTGEFMTYSVGMLPVPELAPVIELKLEAIREALAPVDAGTNYLNFTERQVAPETIFEAERLERLRSVRDRYDGSIFSSNHPIDKRA